MKNNIKTKKINILKTLIIVLLFVLTSNLYAANIGLNRPNDNLIDNDVYPGYNPYYRNDVSDNYDYRRDFTPYIINRVVDYMDVDHKFANHNEDIQEFKDSVRSEKNIYKNEKLDMKLLKKKVLVLELTLIINLIK